MKLLTAIISGIMAVSPVAAGSGTTPSDNRIAYTYEVNEDGKTATLTSALLPVGLKAVAVPETIADYPITAIGARAYAGNFNLEKVIIRGNVKSIGEKAFMSCYELKEVTFSEGITKIPDDCFFSCPKLEKVTLPESLKTIGDEAFYGCVILETEIPSGVTDIGENAIGMEASTHEIGSTAIADFIIWGKTGTAAEKYAKENGIEFADPDKVTRGDVNGDDAIDSADASEVLSEYARVSTGEDVSFTMKQRIFGDVNKDEAVDSSDASLILEIYAKNSTGG